MKKKVRSVPPVRFNVLALLFFAVLCGLFAGYRIMSVRRTEEQKRKAFENLNATTLTRIAELSVLEYGYTDVMEMNRRFIVGGQSSSLIRFSGSLKAGIADASLIQATWNADDNTVHIILPRSTILENTVDISTVKIWDLRKNIFVPITTELKIQEITAFKERIESELETSGFLQEADGRAMELVSSLYAGFGAETRVELALGNE